MAILLNDQELEALAGLPHMAALLYVLAIRPRMDIATGRVGHRPRISWAALAEWLYIEPHPGVSSGSPSVSQVRRAAAWLEKAGLLEIFGNKNEKTLFFLCPKATAHHHGQKQADSNPTAQAGRPKAALFKAFRDQADNAEPDKADIHRREECTRLHTSSSSTTSVDDDDAMKSQERQKPDQDQPAPEEPAAMPAPGADLSAREQRLIFPERLPQDQQAAIAAKVKHLGERAQTVVDELTGHMQQREIRNPVYYVEWIIKKAEFPVWFPEFAGKVSNARNRAAAVAAQIQAHATRPTLEAKPEKNPEAAAALLSILKGRKTA